VEAGLQDGARLDPAKYLEVRYEEVVANPEHVLRKLSDFVKLPYAPEMLDYHLGKTRDEPNLSSKERWLLGTSGLRDWRNQLNQRELKLFEALAGGLLSKLGYPLASASIFAHIAAVADYCKS